MSGGAGGRLRSRARARHRARARAARRRWIALLAVAAGGLGGCAAQDAGGGGRVSGDTLSVVSLLPLSGPEAPVAREILRGEKLALAQAGGRVGDHEIAMRAIDDGSGNRPAAARDAAQATRLALADSQAIAVIGSLGFESARVTVPLLNSAGLLHVSPTVGYRGFFAQVAPGEPERWYPSGRRTFRAADDAVQARATVEAIRAAAGRARPRILIEREAGAHEAALADAIAEAARARGARLAGDPARADAVVYAGDDTVAARGVAEDVLAEAPRALVVFGDDLTRSGLERALPARVAARAVFVSRAPRPGSTAALRRFRADYIDRFDAEPGPYAALGHEAMRSILRDGIARAGARAGERDRVAAAYVRAAPALGGASAFRLRAGRRAYLPLGDSGR